jgi:transposase
MDTHADTVPTLEYEGVTFRFPWHNLVPKPSEADLANLRFGMEEVGFLTQDITLDEENNVIDGENRLRLAKELGWPLGDLPFKVQRGLTVEQRRQLVVSINADRRQLSQEYQTARANRRRERVAARRAGGQSIRQIAEEEGVSPRTICRDLGQVLPPNTTADSAHPEGTNGTPAPPATVTGKDGKTYPATKPKPDPDAPPPEPAPDPLAEAKRAAVLVELEGISVRKAAEEVGLPEATLRGQLRRDEVRAHVEAERANLPRDDVGQVIPPRLREVFALRAEIDAGCQRQKEQTALCNRLAGRQDFAAAGGRRFSVEAVSASKNAYQWLAGCSPFGVCPVCGGKGCPKKPKEAPPDALDPDHCGGTGWVTYSEWKALRHRPLAAGKLTDCPKCHGKDRNCDPCGGSGLVPAGGRP